MINIFFYYIAHVPKKNEYVEGIGYATDSLKNVLVRFDLKNKNAESKKVLEYTSDRYKEMPLASSGNILLVNMDDHALAINKNDLTFIQKFGSFSFYREIENHCLLVNENKITFYDLHNYPQLGEKWPFDAKNTFLKPSWNPYRYDTYCHAEIARSPKYFDDSIRKVHYYDKEAIIDKTGIICVPFSKNLSASIDCHCKDPKFASIYSTTKKRIPTKLHIQIHFSALKRIFEKKNKWEGKDPGRHGPPPPFIDCWFYHKTITRTTTIIWDLDNKKEIFRFNGAVSVPLLSSSNEFYISCYKKVNLSKLLDKKEYYPKYYYDKKKYYFVYYNKKSLKWKSKRLNGNPFDFSW